MIKFIYIAFFIILALFIVQATLKHTELETRGIAVSGIVFEECGSKGSTGARYGFNVGRKYYVGCDPDVQVKIGNEVTVWYHPENPEVNQLHLPEKDAKFWYISRMIGLFAFIFLINILLTFRYSEKLKSFIIVNLGQKAVYKTTCVDQKNAIIRYSFSVNGKSYTGKCKNEAFISKARRQEAHVYYLPLLPEINVLH